MKIFIINIIKYMITHFTYLSKIYVDQNFNYGIRLPSKVVSVEKINKTLAYGYITAVYRIKEKEGIKEYIGISKEEIKIDDMVSRGYKLNWFKFSLDTYIFRLRKKKRYEDILTRR